MTDINEQTRARLDALNIWLSDVYGEETGFNTVLIAAGFSDAQIEQIKRVHLNAFLQAVVDLLDSYNDLSEGRNELMVLHYGLIDGMPQDLYKMGSIRGVAGERIRQLVNRRLRLFHDPVRQAKLRDDFATIGQRLLEVESSN